MASKYPFKLNGYIYSKGTKAGFLRMQRMGIPRPLFRIEDRLARILKARYKKVIREALLQLKQEATKANVTLDHNLTQDSLDDLLDFFDEMGKEMEKQQNQQDQIANRANMGAVLNTLEHSWIDEEGNPSDEDTEAIRQQIDGALKENQDDYLVRLFTDVGDEMQQLLASFSIDKQQLFNDNMDALRTLYIDNSIQRIQGEEDYIKRAILNRIIRYVNGEDDKLNLDDLTKLAYAKGDHMARMFARDQMARFNKAVTLSTFTAAGVTKVKWVTTHDVRVRETHKKLDGKVFDIRDLPPEVDDYNCRCGLVPVEWES